MVNSLAVVIAPLLIMSSLLNTWKTTASPLYQGTSSFLARDIKSGAIDDTFINIGNPINSTLRDIVFIDYDIDTRLPWNLSNYRVAFTNAKTTFDNVVEKFRNPIPYYVLKPQTLFSLAETRAMLFQVEYAKFNGLDNLGVIMNVMECIDEDYFVKNWDVIWPKLNFIFITAKVEVGLCKKNASATSECVKRKMIECREKFSNLQSSMEIIYELDWIPMPSSTSWYLLKHFASTQNISVVMYTGSDAGNHVVKWKVGSNLVTGITGYRQISGRSTTIRSRHNACQQFTTQSDFPLDESVKNEIVTESDKFSFSRTNFGVRFYPMVTETNSPSDYKTSDLVSFINLIGTKFSNILTHGVRKNGKNMSNIYVPTAVAEVNKINKNLGTPRLPLKVFMVVDIEAPNEASNSPGDHHEQPLIHFEVAKKLAHSANYIFEGTVLHLLLNTQAINNSNFERMLFAVDAARGTPKSGDTYHYNLGATLTIDHCRGNNQIEDHVKMLLEKVSFALFQEMPNKEDVEQGALQFFERLTSDFEQCLQNVRSYVPAINIGFLTSWSDRDSRGNKNVTALGWMWKELNDWAVKKNVIMFVDSAFDEPRNSYRKHTGWWKFVKDRECYASTEEYYFHEKVSELDAGNVELEENVHLHDRIKFANQYLVEFQHFKEDPSHYLGLHRLFYTDHFGVSFHPYLIAGPTNGDYTEADIKFLLAIVRTRFSHVMMTTITENTVKHLESVLYAPLVAARLNNELTQSPEKLLNSLTKPLQLSIPFRIDLANDLKNRPTSFEIAKILADEANDISPETVKYLLIDFNQFGTDLRVWETAIPEVAYFNEQVQQNLSQSAQHPSYQLGAIINANICDNDNAGLGKIIHNYLLPHIGLIVLSYRTKPDVVVNAWKRASQDLINEFEVCTKKIKSISPNHKIGIFTHLGDNKTPFVNDDYNLIYFWQEMNKYSRKKSIPVYLSGAFENVHDNVKGGWWSVIQNEDKYVVQEKFQIVFNMTQFAVDVSMTTVKDSTSVEGSTTTGEGIPTTVEDFMATTGHSTMTVVTVGISIIVIIALCVGLAVRFFRKFRRSTATMSQRPSEDEILEFFQGQNLGDRTNKETANDSFGILANAKSMAYDNSLELQKYKITLDPGTKLNTGTEFGVVCKGKILLDGKQISVAVKRAYSLGLCEGGLTNLRSLLLEIKVLSYLGRLDNVLALLGAHTGNLVQGEVYAFFELCPHGSLEKCLKDLRNPDSTTTKGKYLNLPDCVSQANILGKWSLDIVRGMEFLASKQVVHGDLATRNVKVAGDGKAKICDFDMYEKIRKRQSYFKPQWGPLSWQWMSPELLRLSGFTNEKADVWAFGVTLWEIYTLCEIPYAGMSWNIDFAYLLEDGLRLPEPKHPKGHIFGERNMYSVMSLCWEIDVDKRPNFQQIKHMLTL